MAEKPVEEQVTDLLNSWNAPTDDSGVVHLIGEQSQRNDGRGDNVPDVPTDDAGDPVYDDMRVDDLKALLKSRDLPVSGSKDDLVERLEDDDSE